MRENKSLLQTQPVTTLSLISENVKHAHSPDMNHQTTICRICTRYVSNHLTDKRTQQTYYVVDKSDHSLHQTEQFLKRGQIHPYVIFQFIFCVNVLTPYFVIQDCKRPTQNGAFFSEDFRYYYTKEHHCRNYRPKTAAINCSFVITVWH